MYLVDVEKITTGGGAVSVYAIGDTHLDLKNSDHDRLEQYVKHICKDPCAVAVFVGDLLDGRVPGRKHFDADAVRLDFLNNLKSYVNHGLEVAEHFFRPLVKAKVPLVCVSGNHDDYLEEIGLTSELVRRLGGTARYLGGEGFVRVRTGSKRKSGPGADGAWYTTAIYATHGYGGGRRPGAKVNQMQHLYEWVNADVVIAGHVHDGMVRIIPSYGVRDRGALELVKTPRVMYRAPGFVRRAISGVVTYAGRNMYPSCDDGLQWVRMDPKEHRAVRYECDF